MFDFLKIWNSYVGRRLRHTFLEDIRTSVGGCGTHFWKQIVRRSAAAAHIFGRISYVGRRLRHIFLERFSFRKTRKSAKTRFWRVSESLDRPMKLLTKNHPHCRDFQPSRTLGVGVNTQKKLFWMHFCTEVRVHTLINRIRGLQTSAYERISVEA